MKPACALEADDGDQRHLDARPVGDARQHPVDRGWVKEDHLVHQLVSPPSADRHQRVPRVRADEMVLVEALELVVPDPAVMVGMWFT